MSKEQKHWEGWHEGEYQVHFIHTGVGEAIFHIFPDGTTMLVDCGDHPALTRLELSVPVVPNPYRLAGEWVARYILRVLPQGHPMKNGLPLIDYMLLTHYHNDHCGSIVWQTTASCRKGLPDCYRSGLGLAAEFLAFDTAFDRAWPDYTDPRDDVLQSKEADHIQRLYKALQERDNLHIQRFNVGETDQISLRYHPEQYPDFHIMNITGNGRILCKDGSIKNLYEERLKYPQKLNENGMSLGFIAQYGKFSLFSAGDFSANEPGPNGTTISIEEELSAELSPVDVAKITHHGHHSMPEAIIRALQARAWINCVWDQLHTLDSVLERLSDRTLYPGPRTHFPTVFPKERAATASSLPFFKDIAPETIGLGAHIVITVPNGGKSYTITCISPADEEMNILGEYHFESKKREQ